MDFGVGCDFSGCHKDANVGDDECVDADFSEDTHVFVHGFHFGGVGQDVAGDEYSPAAVVCVSYGLVDVFEGEVVGCGAHAEFLAAEVDGVGSEVEGGFEGVQLSCGREYLWAGAAADAGK